MGVTASECCGRKRRATRPSRRGSSPGDGSSPFTVEHKTDGWAYTYERAFVETVSVRMARKPGWACTSQADRLSLCYQKMSSARMSRGETLVLVMQPAQDRPTHDLALAPGR